MVRAFAYLDLVWIDTPLSDTARHAALRELVNARDKDSRFRRVDLFLSYLQAEEEREARDFPALRRGQSWCGPFVPAIVKQIEREKTFIARKFAKYGATSG